MRRHMIPVLCVVVMVSFTSAAYSEDGLYVGGNIGLGVLSNSDVSDPMGSATIEYNPGLVLGVAVGYAFNNLRVEGEIDWQKNDLDRVEAFGMNASVNGDTSGLTLLLNGYYDFVNNSAFTPFISAGIGYANVSINSNDLDADDDDNVFAYQVGAGIAYAVTDSVTVDVKYRYYGAADAGFDGADVEIASHNILAGVRIRF